ncbi:MAG: oligosaccharide flippase family protein [Polyangiaceae bacterium]
MRGRTIAGASWTAFGYGIQQILRLGSNLILTRLLVPEAFGLMALASIFVAGLEMLSDVGVGPAIIQSSRGDEQRFLDTAWTIQVIRGFFLFVVAIAIAWPAGWIYAQPRLPALVVAIGAGIVVRGFAPTRIHSLNRRVALARLTIVEIGVQCLTIGVMALCAWVMHSVWALVIGVVVGDIAKVGLSYLLLPGKRHRFVVDCDAVHEILRIGRWIVFSTAVTFVAGNIDRLTLGRLLPIRELGIYGVALNFVTAFSSLGRSVGSRVLFPVLAETVRDTPEKMYTRLRKARFVWIISTTLGFLGFVVAGDGLIRVLYRHDYHDAGWMLSILSIGGIAGVVNQAAGIVWPSIGEFRTITILMLLQISLMWAAMLLGTTFFGVVGFVAGCASVEFLMYPVQAMLLARRKLWQPEIDLPVLAVAFIASATVFFAR